MEHISIQRQYLTRKEASGYLTEKGIPVSTSILSKYATFGGGPKYQKFGSKRVFYTVEELDLWLENNLSKPLSNSSEYKEFCYV